MVAKGDELEDSSTVMKNVWNLILVAAVKPWLCQSSSPHNLNI